MKVFYLQVKRGETYKNNKNNKRKNEYFNIKRKRTKNS